MISVFYKVKVDQYYNHQSISTRSTDEWLPFPNLEMQFTLNNETHHRFVNDAINRYII